MRHLWKIEWRGITDLVLRHGVWHIASSLFIWASTKSNFPFALFKWNINPPFSSGLDAGESKVTSQAETAVAGSRPVMGFFYKFFLVS
jgi:hypothetical protein